MSSPADAPVTIGIARRSPTAQQDRLLTTLFLAAVLHGMLIAGLTFGVDGGRGGAPALEVVGADARVPDEPRAAPAAYLAPSSQRGGGTTRERVTAELPAPPAAGAAGAVAPRSGSASIAADAADPVLGRAAARLAVRFVAATSGAASDAADGDVRLPGVPAPAGSAELRLTMPTAERAGGVLPDTEASVIAPYLDAWRRKVERLGTLNYPGLARRLDTRISPVLAVELGADGRLLRVSIQRSSGQSTVDQAALEILRLASPFDPFPREMARQYPRLRFAYEWRFDRGTPPSGGTAAAAAYSQP